MRNCINIKGNEQVFPYVVEHTKSDGLTYITNESISYCKDNDVIRLFSENIKYYRDKNNWYSKDYLQINNIILDDYIPSKIKITNIKVYIPEHSVSTYVKSIKYAININTWINGYKIDLGTFIFKPTDTYANLSGPIKQGNNIYHECINFDIIDPFYLIYSDEWDEFRKNICKEKEITNDTGSSLFISMYVIDEYEENDYIIHNDYIGSYTNFTIANDSDYLSLKLDICQELLGFDFNIKFNEIYNDFIEYLSETYNLEILDRNINLELVIKDKENIIVDSSMLIPFSLNASENGKVTQQLLWSNLQDNNLIKSFFNDWNNFSDGWSFVSSLTIYNDDNLELLNLISNEIPITQEVFSIFTAGGSEKIIDKNDMKIETYNVVNKIENNIVQIERPSNESKANIIQPVFFRAKETEILTLHPAVTENISINLDDYKSKVNRFILKIEDCYFNQIGANSYGIIFKITANTLSKKILSGTYYILNENKELITTGKYNCIK